MLTIRYFSHERKNQSPSNSKWSPQPKSAWIYYEFLSNRVLKSLYKEKYLDLRTRIILVYLRIFRFFIFKGRRVIRPLLGTYCLPGAIVFF